MALTDEQIINVTTAAMKREGRNPERYSDQEILNFGKALMEVAKMKAASEKTDQTSSAAPVPETRAG